MIFNILNKTIITGIILSFGFTINAQEWKAPVDQKDIKPAIQFDVKTKLEGKDIYNTNCKSCHGDIGKNASLPLNPVPGDPAIEKFSINTDGELFYKLSEGKGAMPGFKSQLGDNERWAVISYIRSFHKNYVIEGGTSSDKEEIATFSGSDLKILVSKNLTDYEITVTVQGTVDGEIKPANGIRVGFFVERNFGMLSITDGAVTTNSVGEAKVIFPTDLPGDSLGNYNMLIKLIDDDLFGTVEYKETLDWGVETVFENPLDERAMWGDRTNAPLWLIFTYFLMLSAAFITIGYVLLQIKKLKSLGKK